METITIKIRHSNNQTTEVTLDVDRDQTVQVLVDGQAHYFAYTDGEWLEV